MMMMKKILVRTGIALMALIALVAIGSFITYKSMSMDQIKSILTKQVKESTGRTLLVNGPMHMELGMHPKIVLNDVTFSNPPGSSRSDMVSIKQFELVVALKQLLHKQLLVQRFILIKPDIIIETEDKGAGNLDFTPPGPQEFKKPEKSDEKSDFTVALEKLQVTDGVFTLYNRTSKTKKVITITNFTLNANPKDLLAVGDLKLKAVADGHAIDLQGTLGSLAYFFNDQPWPVNLTGVVDKLALKIDGKVNQLRAFKGINIDIFGQSKEVREVLQAAKIQNPHLPNSIGPLTISANLQDAGEQLSLNNVAVQVGKPEFALVRVNGGVTDLKTLAGIKFDVKAQGKELATTIHEVGVENSYLPKAIGPFTVTTTLQGGGSQFALNQIDALVGKQEFALVQAKGGIADLTGLKGIKLNVNVKGNELAHVIRDVGIKDKRLPKSIGPFNVSTNVQGDQKTFSLDKIVAQLGKKSFVDLGVTGGVRDLTGNLMPEIQFNVDCQNPAVLSSVAGSEIPVKGPVTIRGKVKGSGDKWNITELLVKAHDSNLMGNVEVQLGKRPQVKGKLTSTLIDLTDFSAGADAQESKGGAGKKNAQNKGDGRMFPADPLPVDILRQAEANIALQAAKIRLNGAEFTNFKTSVILKRGVLNVAPLNFQAGGGTVQGKIELNAAGKRPALIVKIDGNQISLEKLQDKSAITGGKTDLTIDLKGSGQSIRDIMATAQGETVVNVGKSTLENSSMHWLTGDFLFQLLNAINPFAKNETTTSMDCAVVHFVIKDGVATADDGIAIRTDKEDIVGEGDINLKNEKLDLGIRPKARDGIGVSLASPLASLVRVQGTLADPGMGIDMLGTLTTAASVGAGVATGGLSTVGQVVVSKVIADSDPCKTALEKPKKKTAQN